MGNCEIWELRSSRATLGRLIGPQSCAALVFDYRHSNQGRPKRVFATRSSLKRSTSSSAVYSEATLAVRVCDDGLIKAALGERLEAAKGARILDGIAALRDEIVLRVSHVDPQTASEIVQKASVALLNGEDDRVLWVKADLYNVIWSKFGDEIRAVTAGASSYVMDSHSVVRARLIKKDGTRVFFSTVYTVRYSANF
jgi:hypothetical protein